MVDIKAVCYSHIGKRENHEDNFLFQGEWLSPQVQSEMPERKFVECHSETIAPVSLFAVSDGMGGHNGGEVASRICVEKLSGVELSACSSLEQAVELVQNKIAEINHTVCDAGKEFQSLSHMGTTLVAALTFDCQCAILNIGDSRAYFFDGDTLVQLTRPDRGAASAGFEASDGGRSRQFPGQKAFEPLYWSNAGGVGHSCGGFSPRVSGWQTVVVQRRAHGFAFCRGYRAYSSWFG